MQFSTMEQKLLLVAVVFMLVMFASATHDRQCTKRSYRRIVGEPLSQVYYRSVGSYESYSCGFLWLGRCRRRTHYRKVSATKYVTGYRHQAYTTAVCCSGYTGSPPDCHPVTCPRLSSPSNGAVYSPSREYKGVATYTCSHGYKLVGSSSTTCQASGSWSSLRPSCQPLRCPSLRSPRNGRVVVGTRYAGSSATYSCSNGYRLVGSSSRLCQYSERWAGSAPSCSPLRCPSLSSPRNGRVNVGTRYAGSSATYSCSYGYRLVGSSSRLCQYSERWAGSAPSCSRIQCPLIRDSPNDYMSVSLNSYYVNGRATYSCSHGYEMDGEETRECQVSGDWSGTEPSCQPISCSRPSSPRNGDVVYDSLLLNSVARYTCDSGYKLDGSSTRTCQSDKQWSEEQPSCLRLMCPSLDEVQDGSISVSYYNPGGVATYSCQFGFKQIGPIIRFCQNDETWSGSETASCSRIVCPSNITEPENGTMIVSSYYVGGVATYTCLPGHNVIGSPSRTCEETGVWSGYQPFCQEKCTPSIGFEEPYLRIVEGSSTQLCLTNCSCIIEENFTVELKTSSQVDRSPIEDDLTVPTEIVLGPDSMCFNVTAVDDDLLEGFEPVSIAMYKPADQNYNICSDKSVLPVSIVDNDELTIGFENESISVDEGAETIEICVVVLEPNNTIPIPDVILDVRTWYFGEAKPGDDYIAVEARPLPFSDSRRKACFAVEILEDGSIENDEHFSLLLERNSPVSHAVPLTIEPAIATLKILDNDGIIVSFEEYELVIGEETTRIEACIQARFSSADISNQFNLVINSQSITAEGGKDFKNIENLPLGPFSQSANRKCFNVHITEDQDVESDEVFTLEIRGEPSGVVVDDRVMMITIKNNDEPMPCDSYLRQYFPQLFKHCTYSNCEYESVWSKWEEMPVSRVEIPREICPSRKMCVKARWKNSTTEDCDALKQEKEFCVPMKGEKMLQDLGVGISTTSPNSEPSTLAAETTDSSRQRRSVGNQSHCYSPQEATTLYPAQCQAFGSCPYALNKVNSRDPKISCTKRSLLFVVDSSGSIGEKLFREMSNGLSHLVKHLCGDIQFALLKFSSGAYLEFCFDCYSNDQREDLQTRIKNTKYIGHSSFTGYASKCVNNFMFDSSCGSHDDRCIDIVYVTDGESSDSALFDVCSQVECIHKNPAINDKINIYAINVGTASQREVKCITRFSKLSDNSPPIFSFENLDELIIELNTVIREIGIEQHKYRASGQKPKYQCLDWFNGKQ